MSSIKLPHASGNSMSIAAPATNPASDLTLKLPATIGSANQHLKNSATAGTLEFGSPNCSHACQFHIHTNTGATSSTILTSNWESTDFAGYGSLGSLVTESGGNFSFPETGIWFVKFNYMAGDTDASRWVNGFINVTSDAWVNWNTSAQNYGSFADYGSDAGNTGGNTEILFDVTNTTNCQVQFGVSAENTTVFYGDSTQNWTYATFIRLGDT